jgi:hypothetical protein
MINLADWLDNHPVADPDRSRTSVIDLIAVDHSSDMKGRAQEEG